ncbi:SDR family oxidoreductase [Nonomuraea sp. NPDC050556]|uniref:SDR family oxidoreductase n=1 Tax=Nonomuraea sp. NPDC050556 TaxID=3364369 RepID=UPI0037A96B74
MEMRLEGKTAIVTGASRGIGLAVVEALRAEGVKVVAASRTGDLAVDLSTPTGPAELVERALEELGGLDILVNNVGGGDGAASGGFLAFDDAMWASTLDLNFLATVRTTRAALPALLSGGGAIVNVSSIGARMPQSGPTPYTTAKAALTALGKALAEEFGPQGVRVNTVSPGLVRTAMWEDQNGYGAGLAASLGVPLDQLLAQLPAMTGMATGRFVEPEEVAALVTYLASPQAASVNGADFLIDAGTVKTV